MKNNSGITLVVLIVAVIVMTIIASITISASLTIVDYTEQNQFVAEIKIIREKVNIINKEIAIGSAAYDNVGIDLSALDETEKIRVLTAFIQCNIRC